MGTYPPRECGIATFNQDLLNSSQKYLGERVDCRVVALNLFSVDTYVYPPEVEWKIYQNNKSEYIDLASKFNKDPMITGVMIQHEYGIYGGADGVNLLSFVETCKKPIVVTLHTVLAKPSRNMRSVTARIIERANIIVVLTQKSKEILEMVYPKSINKIHVIPHGIHASKFGGTASAKRKLRLENKSILSTFGLLSRGKGIEFVIRALPKIVKSHPDILYLILGETHPVVRRHEGESYRIELEKLVSRLHLESHVKFYDQYLSLGDLLEFLNATDIYISTSCDPNQTVSGTLSYALGAGRAVISTRFTQALEIVTKDTGRLVSVKDSDAYTTALEQMLSDKIALARMHRNAYDMTRPMLWSNVALQYSKLLTQFILPPLNLTHFKQMTDEFGMFQFAALDVPDKKFGYTLDDNARALIASCWLNSSSYDNMDAFITIYLDFIKECQQRDGTFINYLDHGHKTATSQNSSEDLEDATARAVWALSEVMCGVGVSVGSKNKARDMFTLALPHAKKLGHIRASAFVIKAFANVAGSYPEYEDELILGICKNADYLLGELAVNSARSWHWFDDYLGYNNAIVPEALFIAGNATGNTKYSDGGRTSLSFLIGKTFSNNRYMPIGHTRWYKRNQSRSSFDQQPEDPASMILALVTAYKITHDEVYRSLSAICFSWFLGNNSLQLPLYNFVNGGCFDGLHPDRVNLNQGAESLVSYLLARLAVDKLFLYENTTDKKYIS